jgi:hypothetical protein
MLSGDAVEPPSRGRNNSMSLQKQRSIPSSRGPEITPCPCKNKEAYLHTNQGLVNTLRQSRPNSRGQLLLPLRMTSSFHPQQIRVRAMAWGRRHGSYPSSCRYLLSERQRTNQFLLGQEGAWWGRWVQLIFSFI